MKLPRLIGSGLLLAVLVSAVALNAQITSNDYSTRGALERDHRNYEAAIANCSKAIELDPKLAAAYYHRGSARRWTGDLAGALADLNKAIELKPDFFEAYNNRGGVKRQTGDFEGAVADFTRAKTLDPKHVAGAFNLRAIAKQKKLAPFQTQKEMEDMAYMNNESSRINAELDRAPANGR